jgi:hypothetical protein
MANFPTDSPSPNSFRCSARFRRQQDPFVRERSSGMSFRPGIRRRHKSSPSLAIKDPSACNTPRKWSLSSILIMTLVLASFLYIFHQYCNRLGYCVVQWAECNITEHCGSRMASACDCHRKKEECIIRVSLLPQEQPTQSTISTRCLYGD